MKVLFADEMTIGKYYAVCECIEGADVIWYRDHYGEQGARFMNYSNKALYDYYQCVGFAHDMPILKLDGETFEDAYHNSLYSSRIYHIYDAIEFIEDDTMYTINRDSLCQVKNE